MKILFYFGHPSQYLFLRETMRNLVESDKHKIVILIKTKDVLEKLIQNDGFEYKNILPRERGKSKLSIILSLLKRNLRILPMLLKNRPNLLISTDASLAQLGWMLQIKRITITEDDYAVIKKLGDLTYPFTNTILCPEACDVGKYSGKKIGYRGYMKLAYLHPNIFKPDYKVIEKYKFSDKYVLIRLSRLAAHHDFGIKGINTDLIDSIISRLNKEGYKVYISSEGLIGLAYEKYQLKINPSDMHHLLGKASLLISDSQSMSVEAAMLGIPSIRYSTFSGRISVLEELEHKYQLTFGVPAGNESLLEKRLNELFEIKELQKEFQERRRRMLNDKIDVSSFLIWFIGQYPESKNIMKQNPAYQENFK